MPKHKDYHRFLDESGDTVFFGKGKKIIVGEDGVSKCFILGMVKFRTDLDHLRSVIVNLQKDVSNDEYLKGIPSIIKKINAGGYFFHAKDDVPEVRERFFKLLKTLNCSFEAIVARKVPDLFMNKHESNEAFFYADVLSHLLKNKFRKHEKLVLNIAGRGSSTKNKNLTLALEKAKERFASQNPDKVLRTRVVFNVNNQTNEPLLNVADYFCWSIQNVFERGNTRFYDYLQDKVSTVIDLYDFESYGRSGWPNYYGPRNPLTAKNKISPPSH